MPTPSRGVFVDALRTPLAEPDSFEKTADFPTRPRQPPRPRTLTLPLAWHGLRALVTIHSLLVCIQRTMYRTRDKRVPVHRVTVDLSRGRVKLHSVMWCGGCVWCAQRRPPRVPRRLLRVFKAQTRLSVTEQLFHGELQRGLVQ